MSKKKNKKSKIVTPIVPTISLHDRHDLITKYLHKYQRFSCITEEVLNQLLDELDNKASALELSFALDQAINLYLCQKVKEEDEMDIVILLEEHYRMAFTMVLKKMQVKESKLNDLLEDILLLVIDTYDGHESFSIYFAKVARNYLKKEEDTSKLAKISTTLKTLPLKDTIDDLAFIGNRLGLIHYVSLDDEVFAKFIIYYYGFNGGYVTDEAIKEELNLQDATFNEYLKRSYRLLNNRFKDQLGIIKEVGYQKVK